jgi:hypothetical protein
MSDSYADAHDIADTLFLQKKYKEALDEYRILADGGSIAAQLRIGWFYQEGLGVPRNTDEACQWYKKAAENGSSLGQFYLGSLYAREKNYQQAVDMLNKAAAQNYMPAMYRLGQMYDAGEGVAPDRKKALEYIEQAAEMGHLFAQRNIAGRMIKGDYGITKIPQGLYQFVKILWDVVRIAHHDEHDERLHT